MPLSVRLLGIQSFFRYAMNLAMQIHLFNRDFPLASSFPRRRESSNKTRCEAERVCCWGFSPLQPQPTPCGYKTAMLPHFAGCFSISWIPAYAGMTGFWSNGKSGFNKQAEIKVGYSLKKHLANRLRGEFIRHEF